MKLATPPLDRAIGLLDDGLRLLFGPPPTAKRPSPAASLPNPELGRPEQTLAARLMRVNHTGEICAQALYQGQAMTARSSDVRDRLQCSAREENDHLAWTAERIHELGGKSSYLNPLWYAGSLGIGAVAGLAGDRWSLGFLAETERQVVEHLRGHVGRLPTEDTKSRAIVEQMCEDEGRHATVAIEAGGSTLPSPIRTLMRLTARIMTGTASWI